MAGFRKMRHEKLGGTYQRHHLIPLQIGSDIGAQLNIVTLGPSSYLLNDFHANGIVLPGDERTAIRDRLPMHRGPHPHYTELVAKRVRHIVKNSRSKSRVNFDEQLIYFRLRILQNGLRRMLSKRHQPLLLNKRDPMAMHIDFSVLESEIKELISAGKLL